jgi:flagellar protein FlgJ
MSSYGMEAVAKAIAKGGGLGIAKKVVEQVTAEHDSRMQKREA